MKRINNLYDSMISYSNILFIFNNIKNKCHNKNKLMKFIRYKNCYLIDILEKLKNNNYCFSDYHIFLIREKKYRIIMSETVSDKIVNQMISYFILVPSFSCLIDSNIATRRGKGSSYGYKLFEKYVNSIGTDKSIYCLRIDIKKYFYNINHNILISMLERRIKDKQSIRALKDIISLTNREYINKNIKYLINKEKNRISKLNISDKEKELLIYELDSIPLYRNGYGLSIGCLSNQLMAIFYLNDIDHYIKEVLKSKYYVRYMDDLYILSSEKEYLNYCFKNIKYELNKINLDINSKSGIYRLKDGVSFLGYTYSVKNNKLLIRYDNNTIKRINKKLRYLYNNDFNRYYTSISSYKGYFIRCNTNLFYNNYIKLIMNSRYDKYMVIKNKYYNYTVLIKKKDKYYTYDYDFKYNSFKGNCIILDGNKIIFN